jgi:hypothetical protein
MNRSNMILVRGLTARALTLSADRLDSSDVHVS